MTVQLDLTQAALDGDLAARKRLSGPHRRLVDAWLSTLPGPTIAGDIAALVSQVLRHERDVASIPSPQIRLRLDERSVAEDVLDRSNLRCARFGATEHIVKISGDWAPEWLHGDPRWIDVACASPGPFRGGTPGEVPTFSRPDTPVPIDPAVSVLAPELQQYRSRTQASAVRTAVLGSSTSTLHVVLPTGSGKSLVGLAPGLLRADGTTIVVVPTIALALDQERSLRDRFPTAGLPAELAYYGERLDGEKELIRQRLRAGTQRVVFASPESVVGGLSATLHTLAATGGLTSIVIDEAHLVRSWGLDFRPEYQLVGALVSELRAVASASEHPEPRVIMLTATLAEEALELNDALFRGSTDSLFVGSTFLRTELRYLFGASSTAEQRSSRVVESMRHLPRPAIIYTTRKADADEIARRLRDAGFARTDVFHGDVHEPQRLRVLRRWSGSDGPTESDIVVGTSAFGLGVDQSDVRAVVHACVPASVDRYYQEVGRAGRDGHAAVAVWLTAPDDISQGRNIEGATLLGDEKAWLRWSTMRLRAMNPTPDGRSFAVDTTVVPPNLDYPSDKNRLWNRNTLTLMERAGLLAVQPTTPPHVERRPDEDDAAFERRRSAAWEFFSTHVVVQVDGQINLSQETFERRLRALRDRIRATERASQQRIDALLAEEECWAGLFASEYRLDGASGIHATLQVAAACSGCPAARHTHRPRYDAAKPVVADAMMPRLPSQVGSTLQALAAGGRVVIVTYTGSVRLRLQNLVQRAVSCGVRAILASPTLATSPAVRTTAAQATPDGFVIVDTIDPRMPQVAFSVPTLILLDHEDQARLSWVNPSEGPLRIVVVPDSLADPEKPGYPIATYRDPIWPLEEFMRRI